MEFFFGIVIGIFLGWLIFKSPFFRKKVAVEGPNCSKLRQTVLLSFDNIEKENIYNFQSEVIRILKLYGSAKATEDTGFILTKSTVCLGELHNALTQGVTTQPVELLSHSVKLNYVSLSVEGGTSGEVPVAIHATPGTIVALAGRSEVIEIGKTGRAEVKVRFTRDELLRGYIEGKARKGGLERVIRISIK